jgi:hypothetical protein
MLRPPLEVVLGSACTPLELMQGLELNTLGVDAGVGAGTGACNTLEVDAGVGAGAGACNTLGVDAGVVTQVFWATGGLVDVVGVLKIDQRLSTARSWAWQLSCVRSARMATVRALRQ